jgi:hypothetical protein
MAAHFGLNPALIYTDANYSPLPNNAIKRYRTSTPINERDEQFPALLSSVFSGKIDEVPEDLHIFVTATDASGLIRWTPFHIEAVLRGLKLSDVNAYMDLSNVLRSLCGGLKDTDTGTGKLGV